MTVEKSKAPKKPESKAVEAKAEVAPKTAEAKAEAPAPETKPIPKKQGMGEGQKAVTKAYKDNWNDIFGKKKR